MNFFGFFFLSFFYAVQLFSSSEELQERRLSPLQKLDAQSLETTFQTALNSLQENFHTEKFLALLKEEIKESKQQKSFNNRKAFLDLETIQEKKQLAQQFLNDPASTDLFESPLYEKITPQKKLPLFLYVVGLLGRDFVRSIETKEYENQQHVIHTIKQLADAGYQNAFVTPNFTQVVTIPFAKNTDDCQDKRTYLAFFLGRWLYASAPFATCWYAFNKEAKAKKLFLNLIYKIATEVSCNKERFPKAFQDQLVVSTLREGYTTRESIDNCAALGAYVDMIVKHPELALLGGIPPYDTNYETNNYWNTYRSPFCDETIMPHDYTLFGLTHPFNFIVNTNDSYASSDPKIPSDLKKNKFRAEHWLLVRLEEVGENPQLIDETKKYSLQMTQEVLNSLLATNFFEELPEWMKTSRQQAEGWKNAIDAYLHSKNGRNFCEII